MIFRNVAGQVIQLGSLIKTSDGSRLTSSATVRVCKDGTWAAGAGNLDIEEIDQWYYEPTQAETNCSLLTVAVDHADAVAPLMFSAKTKPHVIYVTHDGNDTTSGTTLKSVWEAAIEGDVIEVGAGNYVTSTAIEAPEGVHVKAELGLVRITSSSSTGAIRPTSYAMLEGLIVTCTGSAAIVPENDTAGIMAKGCYLVGVPDVVQLQANADEEPPVSEPIEITLTDCTLEAGDGGDDVLLVRDADHSVTMNGCTIVVKNNSTRTIGVVQNIGTVRLNNCIIDTTDCEDESTSIDVEGTGLLIATDTKMVLPDDALAQSVIVDGATVLLTNCEFNRDRVSLLNSPTFIDQFSPLRPTVPGRTLGVEADGDLTKVNTLDGHTPQTGDNFTRLGAPTGASHAADNAAIKSAVDTVDDVVDSVLVDTAEIGAAGAGLTALATQASVNTIDGNVDSILSDTNELQTDWANGGRLDALIDIAAIQSSSAVTSIIAAMGAGFNGATDSLESLRNRGDSSWTTADVSGLATQASVNAIGSNVDAVLADTSELQTDWVNGGRLDSILDARATQASVDTVDDIVDTVVSRLPDTLSLANINSQVDTAIADVGLTTTVTGRIDAAVSSVSGDGITIPVNQVPVPSDRVWVLKATANGLFGELPLIRVVGEEQLFAIDFRHDLPNNGRLISLDAISVVSGTEGGVLIDEEDQGVDRSQAKLKLSLVTAGTYIITAQVTYDDSDGGGTSEGSVTLIVRPSLLP
jgi:hypothetical protein